MNLFGEVESIKRDGLTGHESTRQGNDEWLTPPEIIKALGPFDLDPCSPVKRPWPTAKEHYTVMDNGLLKPWTGRVWCNPPYSAISKWTERMAGHGDGILLTFARTDTEWFHENVFAQAGAILFLRRRLRFYYSSGALAPNAAGAGSALVAYGHRNMDALHALSDRGTFVSLRSEERRTV